MAFRKLIAVSAILFFTGTVSAQTQTSETKTTTKTERKSGSAEGDVETTTSRSAVNQMASPRNNQPGWVPALHFGIGTRDQSGNSSLDGDAVTAMFVGTYYFPNSAWLADAGLGFQKNYFRNTSSQPTNGVVSIGGRYQFPQRWSIGPVVDALIGTSDEFGSANRYVTYAGLTGFKEITFSNDALLRVGLKYTSEFGYADQTSNFFGVVLQWGVGSANPTVQSVSMSQ